MADGAERALSDEHVAALVRTILDRPRYASFRPESFDLLRLLGEKWRALLAYLQDLRETDPSAYWTLVSALSAVCLVLIVHIVWTLRSALRAVPPEPPDEAKVAESDLVEEARALARGGAPLEGAHRMLLASLRTLAQRRFIQLQAEDNNRVVCRQLASSTLPAALREQLIGLIRDTERTWFGGASQNAEHVAIELYERWERALASLSRVAPP